ncbi:uncharacterized protein [Triticum aestivum]|uniref:uncharacterized protein n=1 Tax=Triticum aestivum TaxID=4565 RepID=UPI001D01E5F5|nr:uncharacterized protein LOC123039354 [Triticum aestivum]
MANQRARPCHAAGDIADDVLRDVFARLPGLRDLLRCAATCKRWRRLVTDRAFLRQVGLWPETARHPSALVGIFSQNAHPTGPSGFMPGEPGPGSAPQFLSLQLQAGGDGRLAFDSFVADDDGLFDFARPLASRRGLLLLRIIRPTRVRNGIDRQPLHLAVCRPLIDKRSTRVLPPPLLDSMTLFAGDLTGCALLTDADYGDHCTANSDNHHRQPTFQVLVICTNRDWTVCTCTYSSATGSWGAPIKCLQVSGKRWRCGARAGVVTGDTAHWLYMDNTDFYTLSINATTSHVSMTKIPVSRFDASMPLSHPPLLCIAGEGRLSFVTIQDHGVLELWTRQEQNGEYEAGWQHSQLTDLGRKKRISSVFFAESRGALLVNLDDTSITIDLKSKEKMLLVDLEDEKMRHVGNICCFMLQGRCSSTCCRGGHEYDRTCPSRPPVLYEIDLVFSRRMLLTSSQLGDEIGDR